MKRVVFKQIDYGSASEASVRYRVEKLVNLMEPAIGRLLTHKEAERLVNDPDVQVEIR